MTKWPFRFALLTLTAAVVSCGGDGQIDSEPVPEAEVAAEAPPPPYGIYVTTTNNRAI